VVGGGAPVLEIAHDQQQPGAKGKSWVRAMTCTEGQGRMEANYASIPREFCVHLRPRHVAGTLTSFAAIAMVAPSNSTSPPTPAEGHGRSWIRNVAHHSKLVLPCNTKAWLLLQVHMPLRRCCWSLLRLLRLLLWRHRVRLATGTGDWGTKNQMCDLVRLGRPCGILICQKTVAFWPLISFLPVRHCRDLSNDTIGGFFFFHSLFSNGRHRVRAVD
jgi:hypothetical protein